MKVKELLELLQKENPDNDVMLYDYAAEEGGMLKDIIHNTKEDSSYFKGDHPYVYEKNLTPELTVLRSSVF